MRTVPARSRLGWLVVIVILLGAPFSRARNPLPPISLAVDASEAPRRIFHARLVIPANPGALTLFYPKWIPGEHGPTGPITDLAGLKMTADGQSISWQRDLVDMYAFHCEVPAGANSVDITMDFLGPSSTDGFSSSGSATPQLAIISWNQLLLYPKGWPVRDLTYAASLRVPQGWKYASSLEVARESPGSVEFKPVTLDTLVDSPVITGANFRSIPLAAGVNPPHRLEIVATGPGALDISNELMTNYSQLVAETGALFGARHYNHYDFLLSLSDYVSHFGLEHHQSSDNREPERALSDENQRKVFADLLPHEFVHSWNGKYRRPADLATPDYQQPMKTDLLWVYEGLTQYLGKVLAARSGLWTPEQFRQNLALLAAAQDRRPGRTWRSLQDTAVAAQLLYNARSEWSAWRRGTDFYDESALIWLEADVIIRQQTKGKRSLDDFCRRFFGGQNSEPNVVPYGFDDIVNTLSEIARYDWRGFFANRLNSTEPHAPLGGIEGSGWRLVYNETPSDFARANELVDKVTDLTYSVGFRLREDGTIGDVLPGSPAAQAGIAPGMRMYGVNGRRWAPGMIREMLKPLKTDGRVLSLLVENGEFYQVYNVNYHDGDQQPNLEREASKLDVLKQILRPLTARPASLKADD